MRFFTIVKYTGENVSFTKYKDMIQYCDLYWGQYTTYIFSIPCLDYYRTDPMPDLTDPKIREKYELDAFSD